MCSVPRWALVAPYLRSRNENSKAPNVQGWRCHARPRTSRSRRTAYTKCDPKHDDLPAKTVNSNGGEMMRRLQGNVLTGMAIRKKRHFESETKVTCRDLECAGVHRAPCLFAGFVGHDRGYLHDKRTAKNSRPPPHRRLPGCG